MDDSQASDRPRRRPTFDIPKPRKKPKRRSYLRLSPTLIHALTKPGIYGDEANLWLKVGPGKAKAWVFRFMLDGKSHNMGLGALHTVDLKKARKQASEYRDLVREGINPIDLHGRAARKANRQPKPVATPVTAFGVVSDQYIETHRIRWSEKHARDWSQLLSDYAKPLWPMPVDRIDQNDVEQCLKLIWFDKPKVAVRLRGKIESVLDYALANKQRTGDNPAQWKMLRHVLPTIETEVRKHPSLPHAQVASCMAKLRDVPGNYARCLEMIILTAVRPSEACNAQWSEVDFVEKLWTIPGRKMKAGREHVVPLSPKALTLLQEQRKRVVTDSPFVFPSGTRHHSSVTDGPVLKVLRDLGYAPATCDVHGFRSSFRTWCSEQTDPVIPRDIAEFCLAHTVGSAVELAYNRSIVIDRRREVMEAWAAYATRRVRPKFDIKP